MVDRMDQGAIPQSVVTNSYDALYKLVSRALYRTHVEGKLKVSLNNLKIMTKLTMAVEIYLQESYAPIPLS